MPPVRPDKQMTQTQVQHRQRRAVAASAVAFVAIVLATAMLAEYAADPSRLWQGVAHDRNGHFNFALDLILDVRSLDLFGFIKHIASARVWPPVHGLALGAVLGFGGIDMRLAIVPSLAGWCCTIVLTFLIACHLRREQGDGIVAGAIAAVFAMASPAFRLITADVMLEGLGAALSACCIYFYLQARDSPEQPRWWSILGLALTILFFEKYNYWGLVVGSLLLAAFFNDVRGWRSWLRSRWDERDLTGVVSNAVRDPLVVVAIVLLAIVLSLYARGPTAIDLLGHPLSLYPPENLLTVTWAVLMLRLTLLWKRNRARIETMLGAHGTRLLYWHAAPVLFSFVAPKRLSPFLSYVGPTHFGGSLDYRPLQAVVSQWQAFAEGFHVAVWAALLVLALLVIAVVTRRDDRGVRTVAIFAGVCALAVVLHPQQQWRFQTTWLFAVWVLAGVGSAILLSALTRRLPRLAQTAVAVIAVAALALAQSRQPWTELAYAASIHPRGGASDYDLAQAYLPYTDGQPSIGLVSSFPMQGFFVWTVHERCRCRTVTETPFIPSFPNRTELGAQAKQWLESTRVRRIVMIDAPSRYQSPQWGLTYDTLSVLLDAVRQSSFTQTATVPVPSFGATVSIWERR